MIIDAVNAADDARVRGYELAQRAGVAVKVVEVRCSDEQTHPGRLAKHAARALDNPNRSHSGLEQSIEGYPSWTVPSSTLSRDTLDTADSLDVNVDAAITFIGA